MWCNMQLKVSVEEGNKVVESAPFPNNANANRRTALGEEGEESIRM